MRVIVGIAATTVIMAMFTTLTFIVFHASLATNVYVGVSLGVVFVAAIISYLA